MPGVKEKSSLVAFSNDLWSKFAFEKLIEGALRISKSQLANKDIMHELEGNRAKQEMQEEVEKLQGKL